MIVSTNSDEAGAPIFVMNLISALKNEFDFIAVFGQEGPIKQRLEELGIETHVIMQIKSSLNFINDLIAIVKLGLLIKKKQPDIIHAHSSKAGILSRILGYVLNKKVIFTVHGWGWRGKKFIPRLIIKVIEKLLAKVPNTYYTFVSNSVSKEAEEILKINDQNSRVIFNSIPNFCPKINYSNGFNIVMVARVDTSKDHLTLAKAFELSCIDAKLTFVGSNTDSMLFKELISQVAPKSFKNMVFLGKRSDIPDLLRDSELFVLISHFEALPLSIIEAMCAGLPILASDVGGNYELIKDGINGYLIPHGDEKFLADKLKFFSSIEMRKKMGLESIKIYKDQFSFKKHIFMFKQLYDELFEN